MLRRALLGARRRALADAGSDLASFARARAASASASGGDGGAPSGTTSFGYQEVKAEEKEGLVAEVFERVAPSYDLMNDLMSGGIHRVWKDYLVSKVGVFPGMTHLDVAGGTGDVAFRVLRALRAEEAAARRAGGGDAPRAGAEGVGEVIVSDINPAMLSEGQKRAAKQGLTREADVRGNPLARLRFVEGNAERLPFEDASVDCYTIAFGLRNVTDVAAALRDAHRLLKPGGRFMCLEFSHVKAEPLRSIYEMYSFNVIPALGEAVARDRASYQYLVESIRKFPKQEELAASMIDAGFASVTHENLTGGVVAIHSGFKAA
jgi:2-methoxy-6-polyprenyl-1,4-benzoquinol methylase